MATQGPTEMLNWPIICDEDFIQRGVQGAPFSSTCAFLEICSGTPQTSKVVSAECTSFLKRSTQKRSLPNATG